MIKKEIFKEFEKAVDDVISSVQKKLWIRTWEFQLVDREEKDAQYDENNWKTVRDPIWATADGTAFLRYKFIVPAEIEKIPISGSDFRITLVFPSGLTFFVDGKQVYSQRYWADMRPQPMTVDKNIKPGNQYVLMCRVPKGDGHGGIYAAFNFEAVEDMLFQLSSIRYQFSYAMAIAEKTGDGKLEKAIDDALGMLNISDILERNWDSVRNQISRAESAFEPFRKLARKIRVHLIGHAHIDMDWLWTYEETKNVCLRDFSSVVSLLDEFPDLTFSQSQSHVYQIVEQENPELFKKVQQKIREKRWEVTANAWVENDLNMSHGESIARHILYSRKYAKEKLGKLTPIMWCPDTFGHPSTMPVILSDANIRYYFHMRCGEPYPVYLWRGKNKSQVIACKTSYNNSILPERIIPAVLRYMELVPGISDVLFPYGVGDHGGGPTRKDYRMKLKMEQKPMFPELFFSTTEKFFKTIEKQKSKLPSVSGELNTIFEGCYTTHSDIKNINRRCEDSLLTLESAMAVSYLFNGSHNLNDLNKLEKFWQDTLFNQFHDILDGSAIRASYQYSVRLGETVETEARVLTEKYLNLLTEKTGNKPLVFNPVSWQRTCLVKVASENRYYLVEKIPGSGFVCGKNFLKDASSRKVENTLDTETESVWETEFYQITFGKPCWTIKKLYDKKNRKMVLSTAKNYIPEDPSSWWAETSSNLISVQYEMPHPMSAWIIGNIKSTENLLDAEQPEIKTEPLRTVISIKRKYKESTIIQNTILYPDFPCIDFEAFINWQQIGNSKDGIPMVRTNFYFSMENPDVYYEIPFGSTKRVADARENPALRWAGVKKGNYSAAILTKNRHGFNACGHRLSLTLLRNAYEPDAQSDTGSHEIGYRLVYGKLDNLEITKLASEFALEPAVSFCCEEERRFSPFKINGKVLPSVIKPSADGKSIILRLVEMLGKKQNFTIVFKKKPRRIYLSNIAEEIVSKVPVREKLEMSVPAFGLCTLRIEY